MGKSEFSWSEGEHSLPIIEPHTKARHQVTEDYVKNWIVTLCGNNIGQSKRVVIIDGFCGGGGYRDPDSNSIWHGSPIRIIRAVEKGLSEVRGKKGKPHYKLDAKFIFVDCDRRHVQSLKEKMRGDGLSHYVDNPDKCVFLCDEFENVSQQIIADVRSRKCSSLFVLDPTGYSDVSMSTFRSITSIPKSEVLYTFMTDFIVRFLSERYGKLANAFSQILEAEGFFDKASVDNLDQQGQAEYIRNETLRLFRHRCNAKFVYSFALIPSGYRVKYYLIHLANKATAQRVIKESLWKYNNVDMSYQFRYEVYGLGFRTPEYYDNNLKIFDIQESNTSMSISSLDSLLTPVVLNNSQGVSFGGLHEGTMQKNPSTLSHYESFINNQRDRGEFQVFREGKLTRSRTLKSTDIIVKSSQASLFDMKQYIQ